MLAMLGCRNHALKKLVLGMLGVPEPVDVAPNYPPWTETMNRARAASQVQDIGHQVRGQVDGLRLALREELLWPRLHPLESINDCRLIRTWLV
jgi:hypothetical protein